MKNKQLSISEIENMSYNELLKIIISGCKFKYLSYDHKKAVEEYRTSDKYKEDRKWLKHLNSWNMPKELKEKYKDEKIGKLRRIDFSPNGEAWRFYIGNKYAKSYRLEDFGVNVFPLI